MVTVNTPVAPPSSTMSWALLMTGVSLTAVTETATSAATAVLPPAVSVTSIENARPASDRVPLELLLKLMASNRASKLAFTAPVEFAISV